MKIDELVLSLVLDVAGLKKGQAATEAALVAIRSESEKTDKSMQDGAKKNAEAQKKQGDAIAKNSKETEKADKKTQDGAKNNTHSYGKWLASILSIGAAMVALNKFKNFATDLTNSDAAAGRMAANIGMAVEDMTALGGAADRLGGSEEAMSADLFKFSQAIVKIRAMGELPDFLTNPSGFFKLGGDLLPKLLDENISVIDKFHMLQERTQRNTMPVNQAALGAVGFSVPSINAMGDPTFRAQEADRRRLNRIGDADARLAQKRQIAWKRVQDTVESLGRGVTTKLSPAFLKVSEALVKFLSNKENLKAFQGIVDTIVSAFTGLFNIIDKAVSGIKQLMDLVTGNKAADQGFLGNMLAILKAIADTINLIITGYKELGGLIAPKEEDKSDFEKKADAVIYKAIDYVTAPFSESTRDRVGGYGGFGKDGKFRREGTVNARGAVPTAGQRVNSQNGGGGMNNSNNTTTTATINVKTPEQAGRAARSFNANRYAPANGMQ
jgi:hypothetical protein